MFCLIYGRNYTGDEDERKYGRSVGVGRMIFERTGVMECPSCGSKNTTTVTVDCGEVLVCWDCERCYNTDDLEEEE